MKLFVTGATGVLGRPTLPKLAAAGHEVTAIARGDEKAAQVRAAGATPVMVDLFDPTALKDTLAATTYYSNPERRLYGKEVGEKIQEALKTLSEKERLVFELRHYQGLRLKMIGEIMGSTEETAKNYLFRATQKLRAYLTSV